MFEREDYKPYVSSLLSTKNEPGDDNILVFNAREYPDMHHAYASFSRLFNIPIGNFILTNGCENAMKIALLALRVKELTIEKPTWAMVQVDCEALDIAYNFHNYEFKDGIFRPEAKSIDTDFLYTTDTYNNLFEHKNIFFEGVTILDETYTQRQLISSAKDINDNKIIIGSFSKTAGAGLRLGYCLFSDKWKRRFQLLREQYISSAACKWLINTKGLYNNASPVGNIPYEVVSYHPVYITVKAKELPFPHKHFTISGVDFCRVDRKAFLDTKEGSITCL